jgi:hypothetical protein
VWLIHGGDHFTLLIKDRQESTFLHLNGLPPAGPSNVLLRIAFTVEAARVTDKTAEQFNFVKPVPGEIEDIVQAHPEDKARLKDQWRKWRLECVLAVDDPTVKDSGVPRDPSTIKRFELGPRPTVGSKFRCAACYRDRFRTMNFGEQVMAPSQTHCSICGKDLVEAQWSLWLAYDDLPPAVQGRVDRMYAPKLINVLRTRWLDASVTVVDHPDMPLPST